MAESSVQDLQNQIDELKLLLSNYKLDTTVSGNVAPTQRNLLTLGGDNFTAALYIDPNTGELIIPFFTSKDPNIGDNPKIQYSADQIIFTDVNGNIVMVLTAAPTLPNITLTSDNGLVSVGIRANQTSGPGLFMNGTRVVTVQMSGWTAATGTPTRTTFDTTTVTLTQLAERVKALIDDSLAHGLIGA